MDNDSASARQQEELRASARTVLIDWVPWLVYELPPDAFDRRSTPSLIFESDEVMRRVRSYPENWRELSDAELIELSWTA